MNRREIRSDFKYRKSWGQRTGGEVKPGRTQSQKNTCQIRALDKIKSRRKRRVRRIRAFFIVQAFGIALTFETMETREQESRTRIWARSSARFYHLWLHFLDRMGYGRMIRQAIEEVPNPVRRILDIGTGTGAAARIAKELYPISEVLGMDLSSQFLAEAKRVCKSTEIQYVQASAGSLPFRSGVFDLATSFGVICHTADPRRVVQEMIRSLGPGGYALLWTRDNGPMGRFIRLTFPIISDARFFLYSDLDLKRFFRNAGCVDIRLKRVAHGILVNARRDG